jgi:hypothetical protein
MSILPIDKHEIFTGHLCPGATSNSFWNYLPVNLLPTYALLISHVARFLPVGNLLQFLHFMFLDRSPEAADFWKFIPEIFFIWFLIHCKTLQCLEIRDLEQLHSLGWGMRNPEKAYREGPKRLIKWWPHVPYVMYFSEWVYIVMYDYEKAYGEGKDSSHIRFALFELFVVVVKFQLGQWILLNDIPFWVKYIKISCFVPLGMWLYISYHMSLDQATQFCPVGIADIDLTCDLVCLLGRIPDVCARKE